MFMCCTIVNNANDIHDPATQLISQLHVSDSSSREYIYQCMLENSNAAQASSATNEYGSYPTNQKKGYFYRIYWNMSDVCLCNIPEWLPFTVAVAETSNYAGNNDDNG